jgi:alkylation response protein AidB-like acyl-CoA dehydrogenase
MPAARLASSGALSGNRAARDNLLEKLDGIIGEIAGRAEELFPRRLLRGRKIYCSGSGLISRAILTARDRDGRVWMIAQPMDRGERVDLSAWRAQGMRASATGSVDLTGAPVEAADIIGGPGDYHRQPLFSGGAWRFAAAQSGGMEGLLERLAWRLRDAGRGADPHQLARFGEASIAVETARLWVRRAAEMAETSDESAEAIAAYVNLARCAVERAALDLLELVQRSVGLSAFLRPNPIERMARDLATYLRQPAPDRALTEGAAFALRERAGAAVAAR